MDFELVTPFCGLEMEGRAVRIFYQEIQDLAREYVFGSEQEAQAFCNATANLTLGMEGLPEGERINHTPTNSGIDVSRQRVRNDA